MRTNKSPFIYDLLDLSLLRINSNFNSIKMKRSNLTTTSSYLLAWVAWKVCQPEAKIPIEPFILRFEVLSHYSMSQSRRIYSTRTDLRVPHPLSFKVISTCFNREWSNLLLQKWFIQYELLGCSINLRIIGVMPFLNSYFLNSYLNWEKDFKKTGKLPKFLRTKVGKRNVDKDSLFKWMRLKCLNHPMCWICAKRKHEQNKRHVNGQQKSESFSAKEAAFFVWLFTI